MGRAGRRPARRAGERGRRARGPSPPARRLLPSDRPWAWALVGALAASAVWAGAGTVWEGSHRSTPDLHGYRIAGNLCTHEVLHPLFAATPTPEFTAWPAEMSTGPALDRAQCAAVSAGDPSTTRPSTDFVATVSVELHKKTDPGPEFHDTRAQALQSLERADTVTAVPGIGDEAYLLTIVPSQIELKVRHGGAVIAVAFSLRTTAPADGTDSGSVGEHDPAPAQPDISRYRDPILATGRAVMAELRGAGS
ncbi:hypothetical protein [Actinacidiphila yeochonensis]|uniref:hypothetical protein n=1 Tax=Actinacidiphila yeochonensis TaxID=89050 RepID=UPI000689F42B|nr:hypothetical protein [Actinacidiphila yeochonensis]